MESITLNHQQSVMPVTIPRDGLCGSFSDRSSGFLGNLLHMCDAQLTLKIGR